MEHVNHHQLDHDDYPAGVELRFDAKEQFLVDFEQSTLSRFWKVSAWADSMSPNASAAKALLLYVGLLVLLAQASSGNAPGDAYFGKLKMSALRIRYETMQLKKRYETHQLLPEQAEHLLQLTDDAFIEWARRYPKDAWLPSTGYSIAQLYEELPGTAAQARAIALLSYVSSKFPQSQYAQKSRSQLHRGVSAKPYPAWAGSTPAPAPTVAPSPTPTPIPSPLPSATPA